MSHAGRCGRHHITYLSPRRIQKKYSTPLFLILSYLILSYHILSYLILSYLFLSYIILSFLILSPYHLSVTQKNTKEKYPPSIVSSLRKNIWIFSSIVSFLRRNIFLFPLQKKHLSAGSSRIEERHLLLIPPSFLCSKIFLSIWKYGSVLHLGVATWG